MRGCGMKPSCQAQKAPLALPCTCIKISLFRHLPLCPGISNANIIKYGSFWMDGSRGGSERFVRQNLMAKQPFLRVAALAPKAHSGVRVSSVKMLKGHHFSFFVPFAFVFKHAALWQAAAVHSGRAAGCAFLFGSSRIGRTRQSRKSVPAPGRVFPQMLLRPFAARMRKTAVPPKFPHPFAMISLQCTQKQNASGSKAVRQNGTAHFPRCIRQSGPSAARSPPGQAMCLAVQGQKKNAPCQSMRRFVSRNYSLIFVTTPEPTVRPPSRIAKRRPSSIAIGVISSTFMVTLSPGMHISVPSGRLITPVTSVVRK